MRTTKSSVRSCSTINETTPVSTSAIPKTSCIPGASTLKSISNKALLSGIRRLSETERKTVLSILVHLIEIDRRSLYLPLGFSSLFEFCRDHLGYSESTAGRRVRLARCIRDFPQIYGLIAQGRISMSNVVKISKVISSENADALLSEIEGKSARDVELIVSSRNPRSAIRERITPVYVKTVLEVRPDGSGADNGTCNNIDQNDLPEGGRFSTANVDGKNPSTSTGSGPLASVIVLEERLMITFGADPEFLKKVKRIRALLSSKYHRELPLDELFELLMDEYIERHSPEGRIRRKSRREQRKAEKATVVASKEQNRDPGPATGETIKHARGSSHKHEQSRHIPQKVRDEVYARDKGCCSYRSPGGRKCGSTHDLQIDHIVPFARGGDNSPGNLRLLCGKHNRLEAERAYGKKHMKQYAKESGEQYGRKYMEKFHYTKQDTGYGLAGTWLQPQIIGIHKVSYWQLASECDYSPIILTNTRFLRRPSNSP